VELKYALNDHWKRGDEAEKEKIIRWYICEWGGIRGNSDDKITYYANSDPKKLILLGKVGVASWSKALSIYNPDEYAIFDARVSVSLNAIQVISQVTYPTLYPLLPSQNKKITHGNRLLSNIATINRWSKMRDDKYYSTYIDLLKKSVLDIPGYNHVGIYTVEMMLFAFAEDLLIQAFPKDEVLNRKTKN
jgi:hypothetical protein